MVKHSPVIDFPFVRFFFSLLVVKVEYLYAPLNEEIHMKQPLGFVIKGQENLICKMDCAINL